MRIRLSRSARRDLSDIWRYSAQRWDGAQADRYMRTITDSFDRLASGSADGRDADEIRPGYLKLAVGSHVIFYRMGGSDIIEIVRILHRRMDVAQHL